jgi:hypothetical protein
VIPSLGRPKRRRLAHAFLWEYSYKRPKLAQRVGQLGVFLTLLQSGPPQLPHSAAQHFLVARSRIPFLHAGSEVGVGAGLWPAALTFAWSQNGVRLVQTTQAGPCIPVQNWEHSYRRLEFARLSVATWGLAHLEPARVVRHQLGEEVQAWPWAVKSVSRRPVCIVRRTPNEYTGAQVMKVTSPPMAVRAVVERACLQAATFEEGNRRVGSAGAAMKVHPP